MIITILGVLFLFCVVLSWTDFKSHVAYSIIVADYEGWMRLPIIWFQSFLIPISCLCSGKSTMDLDLLSTVERAMRLALDDNSNYKLKKISRGIWIYNNDDPKNDGVIFNLKDDDCVSINGYDRVIPPRIAFLMVECKKKLERGNAVAPKPTILD